MKKTNYSAQLDAYESLQAKMRDALAIKNLPEEIMKELNKCSNFLSSYDMKQHDTEKKENLKGKLLTEKQVKQLVVNATGYTKWEVEELSDDDCHDKEYLKKEFGVEFNSSKEYHVTRQSNSRSDLWLIGFTCLPGHVYITLDTGRVGWSIDKILPNDKALEELEKELKRQGL